MKKTYHGSCHCGRVRSRPISTSSRHQPVQLLLLRQAAGWNVSVKPPDFRLISGKDGLSDYQFGSKQGHHRFCNACGVTPFGDGDIKEIGGAFVSINVACLDDITPEELAKLPIQYMDGRHDNWFSRPR